MQVGLVDAIGGYEEALADLRTLAGDEDEDLVVGGAGLDFDQFLRQVLSGQGLGTGVQELNLADLLSGLLNQPAQSQDLSPKILWLAPAGVVR